MAEMVLEELYGGNMFMLVPAEAQNVSDIREVASNQEVFIHKKSDQSIMLDILQYVEEPDNEAIRTHFEDLAVSNDATDSNHSTFGHIEEIAGNQLSMTQCQKAYYVVGKQMISKFKESARNEVEIHMALFRLPEKETDILLTLNDPKSISPQSSSGKHPQMEDQLWTADHFKRCVMSLKIQDLSFLG